MRGERASFFFLQFSLPKLLLEASPSGGLNATTTATGLVGISASLTILSNFLLSFKHHHLKMKNSYIYFFENDSYKRPFPACCKLCTSSEDFHNEMCFALIKYGFEIGQKLSLLVYFLWSSSD